MRRRPKPSASDEDDDADEEDQEPSGPPRKRRGPHARPSVKPWSPSGDDEAEEDEEPPGGPLGFLHRPRRPVYFRARDSVYFEPLVALAIILLLLVSLFAYTQNWPPIYVIESDSMQHGTTDNLGLINTGDLVLAQKVQLSQITTYVVGVQTDYTTYGEFGDVLLYYPNGVVGTPVIHRAIIYLVWNSNGTWSAPSLAWAELRPVGSRLLHPHPQRQRLRHLRIDRYPHLARDRLAVGRCDDRSREPHAQ